MDFKKIRNLALILALLSVVSLVSYEFGKKSKLGTLDASKNQFDLSLMWQVKDQLSETFLDKDKMNDDEMKYGAISGMVSSLGDPYTMFLSPKDNKSANEDLAGEFGGVGISLGYKDKTLAVMSPLTGTPADKAGIKAGDLILKITDKANGVDRDTVGISLDEAVKLIRGKVGTEVILKMYREGEDEAYDVVLERSNIVVPNIELEWKEINGKRVAWVKLYKFAETLFTDWSKIVDQINQERSGNYGGIVLDLRNNPGGYLEGSVLVASDFIKEGVVVKQASSDGSTQDYLVEKGRGDLLDDKLVVLVNGGSASASEILAGALKEYNRAQLIGEKTFGKGTVQEPQNFKDGSGLHVTIAKWLLPSGKNIHGEGVDPDVEVVNDAEDGTDLQLNKALEILTK